MPPKVFMRLADPAFIKEDTAAGAEAQFILHIFGTTLQTAEKRFFNALRSKSGSYAQAFGRKEKNALSAIYDPSELGSGTTKVMP